jgi:hypothetical protein
VVQTSGAFAFGVVCTTGGSESSAAARHAAPRRPAPVPLSRTAWPHHPQTAESRLACRLGIREVRQHGWPRSTTDLQHSACPHVTLPINGANYRTVRARTASGKWREGKDQGKGRGEKWEGGQRSKVGGQGADRPPRRPRFGASGRSDWLAGTCLRRWPSANAPIW